MLGWKVRIGLLIPSNNTVIEPEFYEMAPKGVTIHSTRLLMEGDDVEDMMSMTEQAISATKLLSPVDVIGYACLATSFYGGHKGNEELVTKLQECTNKPVTTAGSSMVESMKYLGVVYPIVISPYEHRVNLKLKRFLEEVHIDIREIVTLEPPPKPTEVCDIEPTQLYRLARQRFVKDADGIFICATDLQSMSIIPKLEEDLRKPVISTNQALLWNTLRLSKTSSKIEEHGSLLANRHG